MLHIKLMGIMKCSNMKANVLPSDPHPYPRGQKVKILLFQNMAMLHIRFIGITKCCNMVANIYPTDSPTPTLGMGSTFNFFRTWSCCISNSVLPGDTSDSRNSSLCFVCLFDLILYVPPTIFQLTGAGLPGLNQY